MFQLLYKPTSVSVLTMLSEFRTSQAGSAEFRAWDAGSVTGHVETGASHYLLRGEPGRLSETRSRWACNPEVVCGDQGIARFRARSAAICLRAPQSRFRWIRLATSDFTTPWLPIAYASNALRYSRDRAFSGLRVSSWLD